MIPARSPRQAAQDLAFSLGLDLWLGPLGQIAQALPPLLTADEIARWERIAAPERSRPNPAAHGRRLSFSD